MNRRNFLKMTAALGITSFFPSWPHKAFAAAMPRLPIPPLLSADAGGRITLTIQPGTTMWNPSRATPTWGINGPLLGPALRLERGKKVTMLVNNNLPELTTVHWHGLEVPGTADGGPQAVINPKEQWKAEFLVDQPAATCWFHPHTHQKTGHQVAMGLGGLILIDDQESGKLTLPKTWGKDDIPLILQDKRLTPDGEIDYKLDIMTAAVGWFGDMMLTNGTVYPQHEAPRGWLRLRLLNGCNARTLNLAADDKRPLYVIASDGGFLTEPVQVSTLTIFPGERFEVLVDTSDGKAFDLLTLPVRQMGMTLAPFDQPLPLLHVQPTTTVGEKTLPEQLIKIPAVPSMEGLPSRLLKLTMDPRLDMEGMQELMRRYGEKAMAGMSMGDHGGMAMEPKPMGSGSMQHGGDSMKGMGHGSMDMGGMAHGAGGKELVLSSSNFINDQAFTMGKAMFNVKQGQYEKWIISGEGDKMSHPFHIHGAQFRILSENGKAPMPHRSGWKDIVHVEDARSEVLVRFAHLAPPERMYMAHCHLLEHEDTGMMLAFTVSQ